MRGGRGCTKAEEWLKTGNTHQNSKEPESRPVVERPGGIDKKEQHRPCQDEGVDVRRDVRHAATDVCQDTYDPKHHEQKGNLKKKN